MRLRWTVTTILTLSLTAILLSTAVLVVGSGSSPGVASSAGTARGWGDNTYGQLGDGTDIDRPSPVAVSLGGGAVSIATGWRHSLAVASDGSVLAWGQNGYG